MGSTNWVRGWIEAGLWAIIWSAVLARMAVRDAKVLGAGTEVLLSRLLLLHGLYLKYTLCAISMCRIMQFIVAVGCQECVTALRKKVGRHIQYLQLGTEKSTPADRFVIAADKTLCYNNVHLLGLLQRVFKNMKKTFSYLVLAAAMTACGGGSNSSNIELTKTQTMYGFDASGVPYAATVDLQNGSYKYSQIATTTGLSSGGAELKITSQTDNPNVYKVYNHGQHFLAMDTSQTSLLATTKSSESALAEPAFFATQPLVNFSQISGSYYQTQYGPLGIRLNVTSSGTVTADCKNFALAEGDGEMSITYDPCAAISIINTRLEPVYAPYWKLTYEIRFQDLAAYSVNTSTLLFANGAAGRVAYFGENSTEFCYDNGVCTAHNNVSTIWQEAQNFASPANYGGEWIFNRQAGASALINLDASGMGTTSAGLALAATFSKEVKNIEPTRNALDIVAYLNSITSINNSLATTGSTVTNIYGRSVIKSFGGNIASEKSLANSSALFDRVALQTKTFTLLSKGTSGPYVVPFLIDEFDRISKYEVFVESVPPNSTAASSSVLLSDSIDYAFDRPSATITLRSPIPVFDSDLKSMRLTVKAYLTPLGISANPVAWGIRIQK